MNAAVLSVVSVWLVLMLSTAASTWWFSQPMFAPVVSTLAVMIIATVKVGLVMTHFMELRSAPRAWQLAGAIWLAGASSVVVTIYLL